MSRCFETKDGPRLVTHCVSSVVGGQFFSINGRPIQESIILQALATLFGRSLLCQAPDLPSDARA
jgi:DNA mismatch repair ATPase MutL